MFTLIGTAFFGGLAVISLMSFVNYLIGKYELKFLNVYMKDKD